jgi:hypothetical protein
MHFELTLMTQHKVVSVCWVLPNSFASTMVESSHGSGSPDVLELCIVQIASKFRTVDLNQSLLQARDANNLLIWLMEWIGKSFYNVFGIPAFLHIYKHCS